MRKTLEVMCLTFVLISFPDIFNAAMDILHSPVLRKSLFAA